METVHDMARANGHNVAGHEQDTVVHEHCHLVGDYGEHPVTTWETPSGVPSRFVERYLYEIRTTEKPAG